MKRPGLFVSVGALAVGVSLMAAAGCGGGGGSSNAAGSGGSSSGQAQQGGTLHFNLQSDTDYTDPALAYYQVSWQQEYATCLKLLNYPDKAGDEGSQLVPEAASSLPTVSSDGKTYTFTIKPGFKFSPPSTETVTAKTFENVFLRDLNPKMSSPSASFVRDITGASDYVAGKSKTIPGIKANGDTLTISLDQQAPDFLSRVAMPFFCAVPTNTPVNSKGEQTPPSAGPYYVASRTPNRTIVLKKNPNYTGDRPANVDEIDYSVGVEFDQSVLEVKQGQADYMADGTPPAQNAALHAQFGPDSPAAAQGHEQYFVNPQLGFRYIAMNTTRTNFDNAKVRQAVSYAIDRPTILKQMGADAGAVTDQYLPPGIPGFQDAQIYPTDGPDLAKAKQLMQESGVKLPINAVLYTCNASPCPERTQVMQQNLKAIGINVKIKEFERAVQFGKEGTKGEPFDLADEGWLADYADPFDFINVLLNGENIPATNGVNFSFFNDPTYNKKMDDAAQLSGQERYSTYGQLDADLAKNAAPLAAWDNDNQIDFFSENVGCQVYQPVYGMDFAALCHQ